MFIDSVCRAEWEKTSPVHPTDMGCGPWSPVKGKLQLHDSSNDHVLLVRNINKFALYLIFKKKRKKEKLKTKVETESWVYL